MARIASSRTGTGCSRSHFQNPYQRGFQPAMARARSRAFALSRTPGNSRRIRLRPRLAVLLEDDTDRGGTRLGDNEHTNRMGRRAVAGKHPQADRRARPQRWHDGVAELLPCRRNKPPSATPCPTATALPLRHYTPSSSSILTSPPTSSRRVALDANGGPARHHPWPGRAAR